jgi:hypothetical protein
MRHEKPQRSVTLRSTQSSRFLLSIGAAGLPVEDLGGGADAPKGGRRQ